MQSIRNHFRLKKENEAIKDRIIRDIRDIFDHEKVGVGVGNFCGKNYIEYENNRDRNKTLSLEQYLDKIRPYLKDIISNLKKSCYLENSANNRN